MQSGCTKAQYNIRNHFDGMRLNIEYFDDLVDLYGEERIGYVLANTVQLAETDGRYNPQNKEWAKDIVINNDEKDRRLFNVESHPAIVDGVVTAFRKLEKKTIRKIQFVLRFPMVLSLKPRIIARKKKRNGKLNLRRKILLNL